MNKRTAQLTNLNNFFPEDGVRVSKTDQKYLSSMSRLGTKIYSFHFRRKANRLDIVYAQVQYDKRHLKATSLLNL